MNITSVWKRKVWRGKKEKNHINHYNKNKQDSAKRNQCFVFQSFQTIITPDLKGTSQCNNKSAPLELLDTARSLVYVTAVDACKTATRACFAYHLTLCDNESNHKSPNKRALSTMLSQNSGAHFQAGPFSVAYSDGMKCFCFGLVSQFGLNKNAFHIFQTLKIQ